ncbi:MAG TPA: hypothetical protein VFM70_09610 [Salinimicrobium sp.]|nr:hypothetical protein [Salinimicrobium sp.]
MWRFSLVLILLLSFNCATAQEKTVNINGEEMTLNIEVDGTLDLLWNIIDGEYRYFIEKDAAIAELKNTEKNGDYQEEYKKTLSEFTADAKIETDKVKLVLYSLRDFTNKYNQLVDSTYTFEDKKARIRTNLGVFGGITNNVYTNNPENILVPVLGVELELMDSNISPRHSAFVQFRHTSAKTDYDYLSAQLSLNYRFKLIYTNDFNMHIDAEIVNFYYSEGTVNLVDENGAITGTEERSGFSLKTPLSFGVGMDFRILHNGFITLSYNDFVSLVLDKNEHFPVDFTIGYKMSL